MRHVHPAAERAALIARLRKIRGQIQGLERMLERDEDCAEVLNQVTSARRALKSFGDEIIHAHMHECIEHAGSVAQSRQNLRALLTVLKRYVG